METKNLYSIQIEIKLTKENQFNKYELKRLILNSWVYSAYQLPREQLIDNNNHLKNIWYASAWGDIE